MAKVVTESVIASLRLLKRQIKSFMEPKAEKPSNYLSCCCWILRYINHTTSLSTTLKIMPPLLKGYELLDQTNRQTNIECCQPCIYCIIFYYVMNTTAYHLGITLLISIYLQPFEGVYITKNI